MVMIAVTLGDHYLILGNKEGDLLTIGSRLDFDEAIASIGFKRSNIKTSPISFSHSNMFYLVCKAFLPQSDEPRSFKIKHKFSTSPSKGGITSFSFQIIDS
jgi:hypothetical protein